MCSQGAGEGDPTEDRESLDLICPVTSDDTEELEEEYEGVAVTTLDRDPLEDVLAGNCPSTPPCAPRTPNTGVSASAGILARE